MPRKTNTQLLKPNLILCEAHRWEGELPKVGFLLFPDCGSGRRV